jgi:hypothetical protein
MSRESKKIADMVSSTLFAARMADLQGAIKIAKLIAGTLGTDWSVPVPATLMAR